MTGDYDGVFCDGFVGNAILKSMEGTVSALLKMLKSELMSSTISKLGAAMSKSAFKTLKSRLDDKEHGGAPLLGINGGIIKAHGSSDSTAIASAINQARKLVLGNITGEIERYVHNKTENEQ